MLSATTSHVQQKGDKLSTLCIAILVIAVGTIDRNIVNHSPRQFVNISLSDSLSNYSCVTWELIERDAVEQVLIDCIAQHCCGSASSSTSTIQSSLLVSTVTDESSHLDGIYALMRKDPTVAF